MITDRKSPYRFPYPALFIGAIWLAACQAPAPNDAAHEAPTVQPTAVPAAPANARPVHWSYEGPSGPKAWGELSPVYAFCSQGLMQSPIALSSDMAQSGAAWTFNYGSTGLTMAHHEHVDALVDNGHTIQVTVEEGSTLTLNSQVFRLKQFHFHTPSEHTVDGKQLPMEVHLVHQDDEGHFAVVAVLVEAGKANPNFAQLVANLPAAKGDTVTVADHRLDLEVSLPSTERAYHYVGSLTTPPCTEDVQWLVLQERITASQDQIDAIAKRIAPNNRPVQPLYDRGVEAVVFQSAAP